MSFIEEGDREKESIFFGSAVMQKRIAVIQPIETEMHLWEAAERKQHWGQYRRFSMGSKYMEPSSDS